MPSAYANGYGVTGRHCVPTGKKSKKFLFASAILFRQSRIKRLKGALFNTFVPSRLGEIPSLRATPGGGSPN